MSHLMEHERTMGYKTTMEVHVNANQKGSAQEEQKNKRYDRQIRIWGNQGQGKLESAKVCLLGAGPTGSEALKNLVLGGISSYTVIDGQKVEPRDLGNNFLVEADSLGQSRAECCSRLLQEFSESVSGSYVAESPEHVIDKNPNFFKDFTLVIASQLGQQYQIKLDKCCRRFNTKVIFARTYGLFGFVRLSVDEHYVVEAKPENTVRDLRVHHPWSALLDYVETLDLTSMDDMTYKHVPYLILLIKVASAWIQTHGCLPSDRTKQREFKSQLREMQRETNGIKQEAENFKEAVENAHQLWAPPQVPSELSNALASSNVDASSPKFWIMIAALQQFVDEGDGSLPLPGGIPDMTSTTDLYLELKKIYDKKAEEDMSIIARNVRQILEHLQRDQNEISMEDIALFCKNSRYVRAIKYSTLDEEYSNISTRSSRLQSLLVSEDTSENACIYLLLRAADRFHETYGHFPGYYDKEVQEDIGRLKSIVMNVYSEMGLSSVPATDDYVTEMCRCGAGEIHTVAAVIGGIAAEEAIKLITEQFIPLHGTLIYNAIRSTTLVLKT